jgi:hypothetical protein
MTDADDNRPKKQKPNTSAKNTYEYDPTLPHRTALLNDASHMPLTKSLLFITKSDQPQAKVLCTHSPQ